MSTQRAVDMGIFQLTVHTRRLAATGSTAPGGKLPIPHMQRDADLPARLRHQARNVIPVHDLHALGLLEDSIEQHRFGNDPPHVVPHRQSDAIVLGELSREAESRLDSSRDLRASAATAILLELGACIQRTAGTVRVVFPAT